MILMKDKSLQNKIQIELLIRFKFPQARAAEQGVGGVYATGTIAPLHTNISDEGG